MRKVDFLVIGAMKSATTALCDALSQHPQIAFPKNKEPQFFSQDNWQEHLPDYHKKFKFKNGILYGEGSTNYSKHPFFNKNIHEDIFNYNPHIKIIYIVRNPIERIVSHYTHSFNRGYEKNELNTAIKENPIYLETSRYYKQMECYLNYFKPSHFQLLFFDHFIENPEKEIKKVFDFLHIPPTTIDPHKIKINNSNHFKMVSHELDRPKSLKKILEKLKLYLKNEKHLYKKPQLTDESKQFLVESLKSDVKSLEKYTQRDLSHWLQ